MFKKFKSVLTILVLVAIFAALVVALAACDRVSVTGIELDGEYKTQYFLGERDLDISGMLIRVVYTGEDVKQTFNASDIRGDLGFSNFSTTELGERDITVIYRNSFRATFTINVVPQGSDLPTHSVTFNPRQGSFVGGFGGRIEVPTFGMVNQPSDPARANFYFNGWFLDEGLSILFDFSTARITQDITLYAAWGNLITVRFLPPVDDENHPHWFPERVITDVRQGETPDIPPMPQFEGVTGAWDFYRGWENLIHNEVIRARYTVKRYTVRFIFESPNGQQQIPILIGTFDHGSDAGATAQAFLTDPSVSIPERNFHTIVGWENRFTRDRRYGDDGYLQLLGSVTSDTDILAVYQPILHTVTFDFSEIVLTNRLHPAEVRHGALVSAAQVPDPEVVFAAQRQNAFYLFSGTLYRFGGWYTDPEFGFGTEFIVNNTIINTADMQIHARWVPQVTLTFRPWAEADNMVGAVERTSIVYDGVTYTPIVVILDYNTSASNLVPAEPEIAGSVVSWARPSFASILQDATVFLNITPITFTVRFYYFDRVTEQEVEIFFDDEVAFGAQVPPPVPPAIINNGRWEFTGDFNDTRFNNVRQNLNIEALYRRARFNVTFEFNQTGVTGFTPPHEIPDGVFADTAILPASYPTPPARAGFAFVGWYANAERTVAWNENNLISTNNTTIFAKWSREFTLHFRYATAEGQSEPQFSTVTRTVLDGQRLPLLEVPIDVLSLILGQTGRWTTTNWDPVDFNSFVVNANESGGENFIIITARYSPQEYTVLFNAPTALFWNGTEYVPWTTIVDIYSYGDVIVAPLRIPVLEGHTFEGWQGFRTDPPILAMGNRTFEARFEPLRLEVRFFIKDPSDTGAPNELVRTFNVPFGTSTSTPLSPDDFLSQGYEFRYWYFLDGDSNKVLTFNNVRENRDYFAHFEIKTYDVRFENLATLQLWGTSTVQHGSAINITDAQNAVNTNMPFGFVFASWRVDGVDMTTAELEILKIEREGRPTVVVYIRITEDEFTVTLHLNGGIMAGQAGTVEMSVLYRQVFNRPIDPTRVGYAFLGWFTEPTGGARYNFRSQILNHLNIYARWAERIVGEGFDGDSEDYFEFNEQTLTFALFNIPNVARVEIPSHVFRAFDPLFPEIGDFYPVTSIINDSFGRGAAEGRNNLVEIIIPFTVRHIGARTFIDCTRLTEIYIPAPVQTIGAEAFRGASSLVSVDIAVGSELFSIGDDAFTNATKLSFINLQEATGLVSLGARAFLNNASLVNVILPASLQSIGEGAFMHCVSLRWLQILTLTMPNAGFEAFLNVPETFKIYTINRQTFTQSAAEGMGTHGLGWLSPFVLDRIFGLTTVPPDFVWAPVRNYVTECFTWSFEIFMEANERKVHLLQYLGSNQSVVIPSHLRLHGQDIAVASLAPLALDINVLELKFNSCLILIDATSLSFASRLTKLEVNITNTFAAGNSPVIWSLFNSASNLDTLIINSLNITLSSFFGDTTPANLRHVIVLESANTQTVANGMFEGSSNLFSVTLPSNLVAIGNNAFAGCSQLTQVIFEGGGVNLLSIGARAFENAFALSTTGLVIPNTVEEIGVNALLRTAFIGWYENRFNNLSGAPQNGEQFVILGNQILYMYLANEEVVRIPSTLRKINPSVFEAKSLRVFTHNEMDIATNIQLVEIGARAFANSPNLELVVIPLNVVTIGDEAFRGAGFLTKVVFIQRLETGGAPPLPTVGTNAFLGTHAAFGVYASFASQGWGVRHTVVTSPSVSPLGGGIVREGGDAIGMALIAVYGLSANRTVDLNVFGAMSDDRLSLRHHALPRATQRLIFNAAINIGQTLTVGNTTYNAFSGLTNIVELTITNTSLDPEAMASVANRPQRLTNRPLFGNLVRANRVTKLNVDGGVRLLELFSSAVLPAHLTHVEITGTTVAPFMFEGSPSITQITANNLTVDGVGRNAFHGSGWFNLFVGDYVYLDIDANTVLLLGYKGSGNMVHFNGLPSGKNVVINRFFFQNGESQFNLDIEIIFMPSNITRVLEGAFAGMGSLIKIFFESAAAVNIAANAFGANAAGFEIFVANSLLTNYASLGTAGTVRGGDAVESVGNMLLNRLGGNTFELLQLLSGNEVALSYTVGATPYNISLVGNNVLFKNTQALVVDVNANLKPNSFANLKNLTSITVKAVSDTTNAAISGFANQLDILLRDNANLTSLTYSGAIPLFTLLGLSEPMAHQNINVHRLNQITFSGETNFIANLALLGARAITVVNFNKDIEFLGTYALESTLWYINYQSVEGSDFVIINNILYSYKGNANTPDAPAQIRIINSYAFAVYQMTNNYFSTSNFSGRDSLINLTFSPNSQIVEIREFAFFNSRNLHVMETPLTLARISPLAFVGTYISYNSQGLLIVENMAKTTAAIVHYNGVATNLVINITEAVWVILEDAFKGNATLVQVGFNYDSAGGTGHVARIFAGAFQNIATLTTFDGVLNNRFTTLTRLEYIGANAFLGTAWWDTRTAMPNGSGSILSPPDSANLSTLLLYAGNQNGGFVHINSDTDPLFENVGRIAAGAFASVNSFTIRLHSTAIVIEAGALKNATQIQIPLGTIDEFETMYGEYEGMFVQIP
jgi:uncharacterized repeat protein (TIGR02543 family)